MCTRQQWKELPSVLSPPTDTLQADKKNLSFVTHMHSFVFSNTNSTKIPTTRTKTRDNLRRVPLNSSLLKNSDPCLDNSRAMWSTESRQEVHATRPPSPPPKRARHSRGLSSSQNIEEGKRHLIHQREADRHTLLFLSHLFIFFYPRDGTQKKNNNNNKNGQVNRRTQSHFWQNTRFHSTSSCTTTTKKQQKHTHTQKEKCSI